MWTDLNVSAIEWCCNQYHSALCSQGSNGVKEVYTASSLLLLTNPVFFFRKFLAEFDLIVMPEKWFKCEQKTLQNKKQTNIQLKIHNIKLS